MTWGAVAGAAIGVVGSAMTNRGGSQTNGGAGTQTQTKEPWAAAQPWITSNLAQGQNLQNAYTAQPFSALQNQAYQNQANQSAYMHGLVPNLLGQISGQQVGFDRSNPNARPTAFNFGAADSAGQQSASASQPQGLGLLNMAPTTLNLNANTPQVAAPAAAPASQFMQQSTTNDPNIAAFMSALGQKQTAGSYGTFKYGDMPVPGTQQYYDMKQYLAYGGNDPKNLYGGGSPYIGGYGNGTADGNSSGSATGAAASDGSGGGTAF